MDCEGEVFLPPGVGQIRNSSLSLSYCPRAFLYNDENQFLDAQETKTINSSITGKKTKIEENQKKEFVDC